MIATSHLVIVRSRLRLALTLLALTALLTAFLPDPQAHAQALPPTVVERARGLTPDDTRRAPVGQSDAATMPIPFSTVGFMLPVDRSELTFRTSPDGNTWTPWLVAERIQGGPESFAAEGPVSTLARMTEPVYVGEAQHVQVRLLGDGLPLRAAAAAEAARDLRDVVVHVIDTDGLSRSLTGRISDAVRAAWRGSQGTAVAEAADRPSIISRAGWGADESIRRAGPYYTTVRAGTLHHTAGSNSYTRSQAKSVVRGIYAYHVKSLGWNDIGYNLLVDRFGKVYEGRYGGLAKGVMGAHAGGFNTSTFGVSVLGEFTSKAPPAAAMDALARTFAWKFDVHGVDPSGSVTLTSAGSTRYASGTKVRLRTLFGHRDVSATACPGDALYPRLRSLRSAVADYMDTEPAPPKLRLSTSADRSSAIELADARARGDAYIYTSSERAVTTKVEFWLDRSVRKTPRQVEWQAPYDFAGGDPNTGLALPLDTKQLSEGSHYVVTRATYDDGTTARRKASFTVDNYRDPVIRVSGLSDRAEAIRLNGATVRGDAYVFVRTPHKITDQVAFWLDADTGTTPRQVDTDRPYDLVGSDSGTGLAIPLDTTRLAEGAHTLAAVVTDVHGRDTTLTATFTVDNAPDALSAPVPEDAVPLAGDWDGDGRVTPGWFVAGRVYLHRRNRASGGTRQYKFGRRGDIPVVGDWNGNGRDSVGVYRRGRWLLRNRRSRGPAGIVVDFGGRHATPVVGDWNGDGRDGIGLFRDGRWRLRNRPKSKRLVRATYGRAGDVPLTGKWTRRNREGIGFYRNGKWRLRNRAKGHTVRRFRYGSAATTPVTGRWLRTPREGVGLVRGATWRQRNLNGTRPRKFTWAP